jgi:hypothetical protein
MNLVIYENDTHFSTALVVSKRFTLSASCRKVEIDVSGRIDEEC